MSSLALRQSQNNRSIQYKYDVNVLSFRDGNIYGTAQGKAKYMMEEEVG